MRRGRYKSPPWVSYKLDSRENVDRFLQDVIKGAYTGLLGTRQASSINGSLRLLLEFRGWIQRTPLQVVQAQTVVKGNAKKWLDQLNEDEQEILARAIRRLEKRA